MLKKKLKSRGHERRKGQIRNSEENPNSGVNRSWEQTKEKLGLQNKMKNKDKTEK